MGNGHIRTPITRKRVVTVGTDKRLVDYGVLKSMIRDEVTLQVRRQVKEIIQPIYQVIMTDPRYDTQELRLPEWVREMLDNAPDDEPNDEGGITTDNDEDFWGL